MSRPVVVAAAAVVVALAGCSGHRSTATEQLPAAGSIVAKTGARTAAQKSFHFLVQIAHYPTNRPGLSVTYADGDLLVPGNVKATVAGTLSGLPLSSELIAVRSGQYLKEPFTGRWRRLDSSISPFAFLDPKRGILSVIGGATDVRLLGSEKVDGVDSYRLGGKVRVSALSYLFANPPSRKFVNVEFWVGKKDFILRRLDLNGPIASYEPADVVRSVRLSRFGEALKIVAPAGAR